MKPYVKLIIVVSAIIIVGLLIYFIWTSTTTKPTPVSPTSAPYFPLAGLTSTSTSGGGIPSVGATTTIGALIRVSDKPVSFFWTDPGTGEVFYLDQGGIVWQAESGEKNPQITQQGVSAVNFIKQSPDGKSILAAFGDPRLPSWGIYDAIDQVWRPLPANILNATWGADSDTLVATEQNGSNVNLVTLDLTKTPPKPRVLVNDLRLLDTSFDFVPPSTLLIKEKGNANYGGRIWSFNIKTSAINLLMGPLNGLITELTNDGSTLITYSSASGFQVLKSQTLQNVAPIPFITLPSKCSLNSGSIVYCFVPTNSNFKSASLPDDYLERKVYSNDVLYGVDTVSGVSTLLPLAANSGPLDAGKPAIAGGNLYFINRFDNYLYALNIGNNPLPLPATPNASGSIPVTGD